MLVGRPCVHGFKFFYVRRIFHRRGIEILGTSVYLLLLLRAAGSPYDMHSLIRIQVAEGGGTNLYLFVNGGAGVLLRLAAGFRLCRDHPLLRG